MYVFWVHAPAGQGYTLCQITACLEEKMGARCLGAQADPQRGRYWFAFRVRFPTWERLKG